MWMCEFLPLLQRSSLVSQKQRCWWTSQSLPQVSLRLVQTLRRGSFSSGHSGMHTHLAESSSTWQTRPAPQWIFVHGSSGEEKFLRLRRGGRRSTHKSFGWTRFRQPSRAECGTRKPSDERARSRVSNLASGLEFTDKCECVVRRGQVQLTILFSSSSLKISSSSSKSSSSMSSGISISCSKATATSIMDAKRSIIVCHFILIGDWEKQKKRRRLIASSTIYGSWASIERELEVSTPTRMQFWCKSGGWAFRTISIDRLNLSWSFTTDEDETHHHRQCSASHLAFSPPPHRLQNAEWFIFGVSTRTRRVHCKRFSLSGMFRWASLWWDVIMVIDELGSVMKSSW